MEKQLLDLVTRMYQDVHEMKKELQDMKADMQDGFAKNSQHIIKLENKINEKLSVLFDGYTQHTTQLEDICLKADKILANQEKQEVEINVIHTRVN